MAPPPVAADYESDATFLMLYMTISEEDRLAIGHQ